MKKRLVVLAAVLTAVIAMLMTGLVSAQENDQECVYLSGGNVNSQNYDRWTRPVYSYLTSSGQGYMRVQGNVTGSGPTAVYYDSDFNLTSRRVLEVELPVFGGFYESDSHYYLVTGQNNHEENDETEVFRITKYDKDWNRLGSCSLFGANTYAPFDAGCCRMDMTSDSLVIRTCHKMYKSEKDGYNHQANVTILIDTSAMEVKDSYTIVMNSKYGYVSHSFNQFIKLENNSIVSVDHGDAHPRSICLMRYPTDVTTGKFRSSSVAATDVMAFPGTTGDNTTGASVGGFEISSTSYLVAGNSVVQDDNNTSSRTRNVFVASVDKDSQETAIHWLTDYAEGETSTNTPQMVRVESDCYMVLWSRSGQVSYAFVNAAGEKEGNIYTVKGELSDCVPLVRDGKVIWYTWKNGNETFYSIPVSQPDNACVKQHTFGHDYQWTRTEDGIATKTCSKCGSQVTGYAPIGFSVFWKTGTTGGYSTAVSTTMENGSSVQCWPGNQKYSAVSDNKFSDMVVEADPDAADIELSDTYNGIYTITWKKAGRHTVTIYPKYNPSLKKTETFIIPKELEGASVQIGDGAQLRYGGKVTFTAVPDGGKGELSYRFTLVDSDGAQAVIRDDGASDSCSWTCDRVGTFTVKVDVTDAGDDGCVVNAVSEPFTVAKAASPGGAPQGTLSVPYSITAVDDSILKEFSNWQFAEDEIGKELEAGEPVVCMVIYTGDDAANYETVTAQVTVVRSSCDHARTKRRGARDATCSQPGYTGDEYCLICGEMLQEGTVLPVIDHVAGKPVMENEISADCENPGSFEMVTYCKMCGQEMSRSLIDVPAWGHAWDSGAVTRKATTAADGVITYTCTHDQAHTYTKAIPKLNLKAKAVKKTFVVKKTKVKKAAQTIKKPVKVTGAKTKVTYKKASGKSFFTVNKTTGAVKVKKGTKAGKYTVKIKVTSASSKQYKAASKQVSLTIRVK